MKALTVNAVIIGITSKSDRSLSVRFHTPELSTDERAKFMDFQGLNAKFLIEPQDTMPDGMYEVKGDLENKTPSQRMRSILFLIWRQKGEQGDFNEFYRKNIENFIQKLKEKLDEGGDLNEK